jgi:hypothetical protein
VENGFHDFSDPRKGIEDMYEKMKSYIETGSEGDQEVMFESLSLTLMHLGIDRNVMDITIPYCAVMSALGFNDLGQAIKKVTMRIGKRTLAVAYAVDSSALAYHSLDETPAAERKAMTSAIEHTLHGMGATVERNDESITITGWDCDDPNHMHPTPGMGDAPVKMNIDEAVSEFRKELDRELGDAENPISRWMTPKEDD